MRSMLILCGVQQCRKRKDTVKAKCRSLSADADDLAIRIQASYRNEKELDELSRKHSLSWEDGFLKKNHRVYVPKDLQVEIFALAHDHKSAGHFGQDKILDLVQRYYWWPGQENEVHALVNTCTRCQTSKYSRQKKPGLIKPLSVPKEPWTELSMDFITQLPLTTSGYDAIIVFVDRLTKMVCLSATTTSVTAEGAANLFVHNVLRHHGLPRMIVSDRDVRFNSAFYRHLVEKWEVTLAMSTTYHPETDGQAEVMNRILEDYLRSYTSSSQKDWDELLVLAEFAMNNSKNSSTRETPFYLNYGRHPRSPLTLGVEIRKPEKGYDNANARGVAMALACSMGPTRPMAYSRMSENIPAVTRFDTRIQEALRKAKAFLEMAKNRWSKHADAHRRDVNYKVGDMVLLSTKHITLKSPGTRKLLPRWIGPFSVLKRIGELAYRLDLPDSMQRIHPVFHVSKLKPYHEDGRVQPPPAPIEIEGELEYEVENIIDKKVIKHKRRPDVVQYLINEKGYGHEHNSWETASTVTNAQEVVQAFENGLRPLPMTQTTQQPDHSVTRSQRRPPKRRRSN